MSSIYRTWQKRINPLHARKSTVAGDLRRAFLKLFRSRASRRLERRRQRRRQRRR